MATTFLEISRPYVQPGTHPIETADYLLPTPAIATLLEAVTTWLRNRIPGALVVGVPRIGKSHAIELLVQLILEKFQPAIPIGILNCNYTLRATEDAFYEDLLEALHHGFPTQGKAAAKRKRLIEFIDEQVKTSGQNRFILFIDDAQWLLEPQYNWLMALYNELDRRKVNLVVIQVGQREVLARRSVFVSTKKTQIVGRFMVHHHEFRGIESEEEMKVCMDAYDTLSDYPIGSGWSFTRYFYPDLFQQGWRSQNSVGTLWNAFNQVRELAQLSGEPEIGMQYFCRTMEYLLLNGDGKSADPFPDSLCLAAVESSGYLDAEIYRE